MLGFDRQNHGVPRSDGILDRLDGTFVCTPLEFVANDCQFPLGHVLGEFGNETRACLLRIEPRSSKSSRDSFFAGSIRAWNRPPPAGKKPWRRNSNSTDGPMRWISGMKHLARKSNGGAIGLCVPPSRVSVLWPEAVSRAGRTVCSTSVALPAVPTAKR